MRRIFLRGFDDPFVTDAGEPEDFCFAGLFTRGAARLLSQPVRQCDYNCHSRLHALPETDELAMDFTLPAMLRASASSSAG
jgi:hypothetical protein